MKKSRIVLALALAGMSAMAVAAKLDNTNDKASYIIGFQMGQQLQQFGGKDINVDNVIEGLQTAYSGKVSALNEKEMQETMKTFAEARMKVMQQEVEQLAEKNQKDGDKFLADNKTKPGVKETKDGLQYKVIKEGTGVSPKADDTVTVNYEGRLLDGTVFDSSAQHGEAATFPLNRVIPGWTEGLQLMKEGGKYTFYIPAKLAYGERGAGPKIGPNSTLIFDVELLKVAPTKKDDAKK